MDRLLQRHHSILLQLRKNHPNVQIISLLDEIVLFLNLNIDSSNDCFNLLTNICDGFIGSRVLGPFDQPDIMNHRFFIVISRTFKMLLTKATFTSLTSEEEQCFDSMSSLITNLCSLKNQTLTSFYTGNNEQLNPERTNRFISISYEKIFLTKIFIEKFARLIKNDLSVKPYGEYHIKYKVTDRLLRLCMKLRHFDHSSLLDAVVSCLKSKIYLKVYEDIKLLHPVLNPQQSFFMYQCPKFLRLFSNHRHQEISNSLCETMLTYTNQIFKHHLPIALEGAVSSEKDQPNQRVKLQAIPWHVEFLNYFALIPTTRYYFLTSKCTCKCNRKLTFLALRYSL